MFVFKWQFSFVYKFHGSLAVFNLFFSYTDNATPPQPALAYIFSNYFITYKKQLKYSPLLDSVRRAE